MRTEPITCRGTPLTVYRWGAAGMPAMLFVNAVGMTGHLLDRVGADLAAAGVQLVTWDLRGSPGPPTGSRTVGLADHVADGLEILDALRIMDIHLGGWCTGASVALLMAPRLGPAALSLTSIDGALLFNGIPGVPNGNANYAMCGEIVTDESRATHYLELTRSRGDEEENLGLHGRPDLVEHIMRPYRRGVEGLIAYAYGIRASCAYDPAEACAALSVPALFVARRDDRMVGWWNSERAATIVPRAEFTLGDRGGHYALFTDRQIVQRAAQFVLSAG